MQPAGVRGSSPASHTAPGVDGGPWSGLRALCRPATLTGGLSELAWVGAHVLMYPLGTRAPSLRPDPRNRPGQQPPAEHLIQALDTRGHP